MANPLPEWYSGILDHIVEYRKAYSEKPNDMSIVMCLDEKKAASWLNVSKLHKFIGETLDKIERAKR